MHSLLGSVTTLFMGGDFGIFDDECFEGLAKQVQGNLKTKESINDS